MSLQYVMGGPSTGKTKFCIDKILSLGNQKILFIVPEQFSLQAEKELIKAKGSIINTQVLSFQRLSFYIMSELGMPKKNLLEQIGKNILIKKILGQTQLKFFDSAINKAGFIDSMSDLISDFYKYELKPDQLLEGIKHTDGNLKLKLQDVYALYKGYNDYVREKYLSRDEMLDILADQIPKSKYLRGVKIFIDSFDSFNPQEYKVLNELMKVSDEIFFTANIHFNQGHGPIYKDLDRSEPYYEIKSTINNITKLAQDNGLEIKETLSLKNMYKESSEIEFLANNYFYIYAKEYAQQQENILLYTAESLNDEVNFVAKKIMGYVRDGLKFNEIAIITGDIEKYTGPLERVFDLYSIPYFIDKKVSIMTNVLVEFIRSAFDVVVYNYSYESVFRFLKTGLLDDINLGEIDLIEDYVLEFGIKGKKIWESDWKIGFSKYDEKMICQVKEKVLAKMNFLSENLVLGQKYKVSWLCEFIYNMLGHFDVEKILNMHGEEILEERNLNAQVQENLKVWNKICEVLDKIVEILGDEQLDLIEFVKILDEGLMKIDLGLIPQFTDQILIGDLERSRIPNVKILFIVGANEGYFPKAESKIDLFTRDEKNFLDTAGMKFTNDTDYKIYKSDFLIYGLISKPSYQLIISCSLKDGDQKQMQPSYLFAKIKKLFGTGNQKENVCQITTPCAMLNDVIKIIYAGSADETSLQIYDWFKNNELYRDKINKFERARRKNLNPILKLDKFCGKLNVSVTELESFAKCPFAHFLKYNLRLSQRKIYALKSVDIGSFLHAVLKTFFSIVKNDGILFECEENLSFYIDKAIRLCDFKIDIFHESAYYEFLLFHIKNVLHSSILAMLHDFKNEKYLPYQFEFEFENVKLSDQIFLNGKIDRIDIFQFGNEKYLRIVDYKSSQKNISEVKVADGVQLQLLMYLKVLLDINKNIPKAGGSFYFHLDNPFLDLKNEIGDEMIQKKLCDKFKLVGPPLENINHLIEIASQCAENIGSQIISGNINIKPYDKFSCLYCPYSCVCQKKQVFYAD